MAFLAPILAGIIGEGAGGAAAGGAAGGMSTLAGGEMTAAPTAAAAGAAGPASTMLTGTDAAPSIMQLLTAKNQQGLPGWTQLFATGRDVNQYLGGPKNTRPGVDLSQVTPQMAGASPMAGGGAPQMSPLTMRLIQQYMSQLTGPQGGGGFQWPGQ